MSPLNRKGGAPVGQLADLDPSDVASVVYLRLWCEGNRNQIGADLSDLLGPRAADELQREFDQLCRLCQDQGRRPLCTHHLSCQCLGADESCFALLLRSAGAGQDADAMLLATLLLRAEQVPLATALAGAIAGRLDQAYRLTATPSRNWHAPYPASPLAH